MKNLAYIKKKDLAKVEQCLVICGKDLCLSKVTSKRKLSLTTFAFLSRSEGDMGTPPTNALGIARFGCNKIMYKDLNFKATVLPQPSHTK